MSRTLMQPKIYNLRLNLEQVQHTADGWVENRKLVDEDHLPLYDSQLQDILDQFRSQDVVIEVDIASQPDIDSDFEVARSTMDEIKQYLSDMSTDPHEFYQLSSKIERLEKVLFG